MCFFPSIKFSYVLKQICCTLRSWVHAIFSHYRTFNIEQTTMHLNVVLKILHTQNKYHHVWKTVKTTLQSIVGLQSGGEGNAMEKNCGTNPSHSFPCFSNLYTRIGKQQNIKVWFWEFSTHGDIYCVCGKLSELQFGTQMSPNPKETVLYCEKNSLTQDLRGQLGENYMWWWQNPNIKDPHGCLGGKYKPFGKIN